MIKFDIGGRRNGKTTRMIQWLLNAPEGESRVLMTHAESEAHRIRKMIKDMGVSLEDWQIVGPVGHKLQGRNVVLGIDNLELVLGQLISSRVTRVTATGELYRDE